MKKILSFYCLMNLFAPALAQESKFLRFSYFSTEQGLGSSNVRKITEDKFGLIWFATQDGLYRYDGVRAISYNKSIQGKHHISGVDIRDLLLQGDTLWVINSYGGINAIDIVTGNVIYELEQQRLSQLNNVLFLSLALWNKLLYIGSDKGLFVLNTTNLEFDKSRLINGDTDRSIQKILVADGNQLWLLCPSYGIIIWDPTKEREVSVYKTAITKYYDADNLAQGIITGTNSGIREYRLTNSVITEISPSSFFPRDLLSGDVFAVRTNPDNSVWASNNKNLYRFGLPDGHYETIRPGKLNDLKDWTSSVFGIYFDKKNNIWLSSQEGAAFASSDNSPFICYHKSASTSAIINHSYFLFPYNDSTLYVCAEDGLYKTGLQSFHITPVDQGRAYFFAFENFDRRIIVSNEDDSYILDGTTLLPMRNIYPEFESFGQLIFNSMIKLNDSCIVLGSQNEKGVYSWNPLKKRVTNISANSLRYPIADNDVNTLYKLSDTTCLVLASNSLSLFTSTSLSAKEIIIKNPSDNKKYLLFFDICRAGNQFYLSSYGNGLLILDLNLKFVKNITVKDGLANNSVYKVFPYADSIVYASTNNGLSLINTKNSYIKNYYSSDGIHSNVFEELSGNTRKQVIYLGGADGFTAIYPDFVITDKTRPVVSFTNIMIDRSPARIIDTSNLLLKKIAIPNNAKQTTIFFTALNFSNPKGVRYYYRIPEIQDNWLFYGNQDYITLIGLKPGTYHLQVKALNADGIEGEYKELTLIFLPKWYQTWWFKVLLALVFMAIVYALYRIRINQLKKEEKIRNQLAGDLHDELGSTLNSVKIFASLALMEKEKEKTTPHLEKIKEATQGAISGVKDIIWVLDDNRDTVDDLLTRINQFVKPLCELSGISYSQQADESMGHDKLGKGEKRNLYMIIKESINNSIKYADCKNIELLISTQGGKMSITITDDGKGFDRASIIKGNGLKNIVYRAKETGYHATIASSPGNGTVIRLEKLRS